MESPWTKRTIHRIAKKYGLSYETVRWIVKSQFQTVADELRAIKPENGPTPEIHLPRFAYFKVKKNKLPYLRGKKYYKELRRKRNLDTK